MTIHEDARVTIFLADYVDASNPKINALGIGFTIAQMQPGGLSTPQYVQALIDVPATYVGQEYVLALELRDDETGEALSVPGPDGTLQALRVQQVQRVEPVPSPVGGPPLPVGFPTRLMMGLGLANGLPLKPGRFYTWVLSIDGHSKPDWVSSFWVASQVGGPVFGGPISPTTIPGVSPPH